METGFKKYRPFTPPNINTRRWPSNTLTSAPVWCSVDLRDGNQALVTPMDVEDKLRFFKTLTDIGIKEIEIGFPASSEQEFEVTRTLIEQDLIPDDVTIQFLVQAREHLIRQTFDAIAGAKHVILHFYNTTSWLQRKVVFDTDVEGVTKIAVEAAELIRELGEKCRAEGMDLRYEYSPESFSCTECDVAVSVCEAVIKTLGATPDDKVILNLPATVEHSMPNQFADLVESFIDRLPSRDCAIISVHTHNDRGTGVAATELALLAGAERVEGTLFGNGERTGNVDLVTLALNLYSQGFDPGLDFSDIKAIRRVYESCTGMRVPERHPYAGDLVFTAFSGSHQDAINKGFHYMREHNSAGWEIPYLPIDPADVGRRYEPVIRINSQSGKGGAAFVMEEKFGLKIPKALHPELGALIQAESEITGAELPPTRMFELFEREYINISEPYSLVRHSFTETLDDNDNSHVKFEGTLRHEDTDFSVTGEGNGPIDAFFNAIHGQKVDIFSFVDYSEHAITDGSDSRAVAYIHLRNKEGRDVFGVGISHNINLAPLRGIISAINRDRRKQENKD